MHGLCKPLLHQEEAYIIIVYNLKAMYGWEISYNIKISINLL